MKRILFNITLGRVLGALLAGVILGPVVLNLMAYNGSIQLHSSLSVILLMFLAKLETNVEQLKGRKIRFRFLILQYQ